MAIRGRSALFDCDVSGLPKPIVEWKKDGRFLSLKGDDRREILANGSLLFKEVGARGGARVRLCASVCVCVRVFVRLCVLVSE